ncbi:hypothetical protein D3C86_2013300 [compost metagenome]
MVGVGQGTAQALDHGLFFPGFEQACRLRADLLGRVVGQGCNKPGHTVRVFQVSQIDQGDTAHASVIITQAWQQLENGGVITR